MTIDFDKYASFVMNIFDLDINSKKNITKVYKELNENANDYYSDLLIEMRSKLIDMLDKIVETVPYSLIYDENVDISSIYKAVNMRINQMDEDQLSQLCDFIRLERVVCGVSTFIVVNLKDYFNDDEINGLYEFIFYNKVNLIIIESHQTSINCPYEKNWIIDNDNCIIEVN